MDQNQVLKKYFGYDNFREGQAELVSSILSGRDTLGVMPTGAGKSVCYQVPALMFGGVTIVISPLISLMQDQVSSLVQSGIPAAFINSSLTMNQLYTVLKNAERGAYKLIYVAPERLDSEVFMNYAMHAEISMITVDEAHCISQWGQDFRPSYLNIPRFAAALPKRPVMTAFTATATERVRDDIARLLELKDPFTLVTGFDRKNLYFEVRRPSDKYADLKRLVKKYDEEGRSGIIYCSTRKNVETVCERLCSQGFSATRYHAGLAEEEKRTNQDDFIYDRRKIMVATNAFGMGIDKPDVRIVLHIDLPDSPEAYFQEAGRAGRDGLKAYAVILYAKSDKMTLHKRVADTFPEKEYILQVYEHLQYYYQMAMGDGFQCIREFNLEEFCRKFKYFPVPVDSALKILTQAGYLEYTDEQDNASRILFTIRRDELYKLREMGTEAETLIQTILRSYTGVFTDYAYISEDTLAIRTGLTRQQIYNILVTLTKRRIVDYIPHKKTPYIIYTRERLELRYLHIPASVYEERKARYEARIKAMEEYVTSESVCRSRMLLRYFGEKNEHNCKQCDVCLNRHETDCLPEDSFREMRKQILELLTRKSLPPAGIANAIEAEREDISRVIQYLLEEGELKMQDGMLHISK